MPEEKVQPAQAPDASGVPAANDGHPEEPEKIEIEIDDVIRDLNVGLQESLTKTLRTAIKQESFRGPLPHPGILKGYEEIKAGFAERIVGMAEKEQAHRFECDEREDARLKSVIEYSAANVKRGQLLAFIIAVLVMGSSVALALLGHEVIAGIFGGGTLVSLVTVFITGKRSTGKEDEDATPPGDI